MNVGLEPLLEMEQVDWKHQIQQLEYSLELARLDAELAQESLECVELENKELQWRLRQLERHVKVFKKDTGTLHDLVIWNSLWTGVSKWEQGYKDETIRKSICVSLYDAFGTRTSVA